MPDVQKERVRRLTEGVSTRSSAETTFAERSSKIVLNLHRLGIAVLCSLLLPAFCFWISNHRSRALGAACFFAKFISGTIDIACHSSATSVCAGWFRGRHLPEPPRV